MLLHGITPGCQGCARAAAGGVPRNHREKCRDRFEAIFIGTGDERLLRQAERFRDDNPPAEPQGAVQPVAEVQIPDRDDPMSDADDEQEDEDAMVFALTDDNGTRKLIQDMGRKMQQEIKSANWEDDVEKMERALSEEGIGTAIMELYSPTRINGIAAKAGVMPGLSLDLTTTDPDDGLPWDFNNPDKRKKALDKVLGKESLLLVGSPMCKAFSRLQNLNKFKRPREEVTADIKEGMTYLQFCCVLYQIQWEQGRYFLHEHPHSASSWDMPAIKSILDLEGVENMRVTCAVLACTKREKVDAN